MRVVKGYVYRYSGHVILANCMMYLRRYGTRAGHELTHSRSQNPPNSAGSSPIYPAIPERFRRYSG